MLKRLHVRNFTVFADAEFEFSPGLNVIVGTNGTGKSHVLKLGYVVTRATAKVLNDEQPYFQTVHNWQDQIARRLLDVFQPEGLSDLIRGNSDSETATVDAAFATDAKLSFTFDAVPDEVAKAGKVPVRIAEMPRDIEQAGAVFIPPKEILTMPWLRGVRKERRVRIDDTYPSLLDLMEPEPLYEPTSGAVKALTLLEDVLQGQVEEKNGRYYLLNTEGRRREMNMVAEGLRKFGMLERLLRNGSLTVANTLFWDEPEANLNNALLRKLAVILIGLANAGFQIILATHSLFLLKELHILSRRAKARPVRYFGLFIGPEGDTQVETTDDFELLQHITALDAELTQTFDYEETLDQDAAADADDTRG